MIAASLISSASWAPEKPPVSARSRRSRRRPPSGLPSACTRRISRRPSSEGVPDRDLPREAARSQQRRVEHVGPVRRGDHDHVRRRCEAVHLHEQLVEGLLAFAVALVLRPAATDRVDLVEEDHTRGRGERALEQISHPASTDADVLLDELRAARREEADARFAGERTREQCLASAGRAAEKQAGRHAGADLREPLRRLEEGDDLGELLHGFVAAGDVLEAVDRGGAHLDVAAQAVGLAGCSLRRDRPAPRG